MLDRFLDSFAEIVTRRRGWVLGAVLGFVAFCAFQLPNLKTETSPENLLISFGGYHERVDDFQRHFGDTDSVVVLLVKADDVTQREPLDYVHLLSRHFRDDPDAVRVESLTVTPLPGAEIESGDDDLTLDDLDSLDGAPMVDPEYESTLESLIASAPEFFPMGLHTIADRMGDGQSSLHGVVRGEHVTEEEASAIRNAILDLPLVLGRLVSRSKQLASVVVFLNPALGTGEGRVAVVHEIDQWLAENPPPPGIFVEAAGIPHLRAAISDAMIADQTMLVPLSLLVCIVLLFVSFRWLPATLLPVATVGMTVVCVLGSMALFGEPMTILMNTLPTLLIIMGISEAVHLIGRYIEESRRHSDRIEASRRAIRQLAIACFLTSFTTAVGFGSLIVAETEMLRHFGMIASLGVMIGYLILITFIPSAITYFGSPRRAATKDNKKDSGVLEAFLLKMTAWIIDRPLIVIGLTAALMIPCSIAYFSVRVDTALLDTFDPDDPIVSSTRLMEAQMDGIRPLEILVESDTPERVLDPEVLAALDRIAVWARQQNGILRATTPSDFLFEVWRRLAGLEVEQRETFRSREQVQDLLWLLRRLEPSPIDAFLTSDGEHARVELRVGDIGAQNTIRIIEAVEDKAREELAPFADIRFSMLGEAFIGSHGVDSVVHDMFSSLSLSAVLIFLTIGILFRSVRLAFLAIPPNVIPQVGTVAWMVLRGIPLNASTAIVFSVAIGVSVDLTIHGFARLIEEEERGLRRRAAILRSARGTGRAIVVSCATLVFGFGALLMSGFVPVRHFGELIAAALTMSLLATLVFQPAMLVRFGGRQRPQKRS